MLSITQRLPILAIAVFTLLAATAQATHWPMEGGDAGRSGNQPGDQAALPMKFRGRANTGVATSPIITAGADLTAQRIAYGYYTTAMNNTDGRLGLFNFATPATPVGTAVDIDDENPRDGLGSGSDDPDQFGPAGDVTPMEASTHTGGPTSIYAVHNDDNQSTATPGAAPASQSLPNPNGNDLAIAQVNSSTGALIRDFYIGSSDFGQGTNTNGMTITSAPVMGSDQGGERDIFFFASKTSGMPAVTTKHLVMVSVNTAAAATATNVVSGLVISPNIADLNLSARPALATLKDPDAGFDVSMVVLPTTDGLKTVRISDPQLDDFGPSISGLGTTWTPSIPVQGNGNAPTTTPFLYVASASAGGTVVRKLAQGQGDSGLAAFELAEGDGESPELDGTPGPGLAVAQQIPTSGAGAGTPQPGRVLVGTSANLYSLHTENLSAAEPPQLFDSAVEKGFGKTTPSTSGNLGFAVTEAGQEYVFYLTPVGGEMRVPLEENGFLPNEDALNSTSSLGQPAISRGRVVFPANNGMFVYGPNVSILQPTANGSVSGSNVTLEAYVVNPALTNVTFRIDGVVVGSDNTLDANHASVQWNSQTVGDGAHSVTAEATDGATTETSAPRVFIVNNWANPTAALTVSPNPGNVGQEVTLNASGSAPTPGEAGETITRWAFEIDGDNDFDDIVENAPGDGKVTTVFSTPGSKTVRVRVTDSHGDTATANAVFRVNSPPSFTLKATPNPATPGQSVEIDATATDSDGTIAKYEFDLDGNGTFEKDNGTTPKTTATFTVTTTVGARVTDNEGGQTVKTVTVTLPPLNQAPTASFLVAPNPAKTNVDVGFSAAASKDPDGTITKYEWDFDGNGTFEVNNAGNPLIAHKFPTAGVFKVALRVTDNAGATATTTVDVIVTSSRVKPGLTASVSPKRDRSLPYVFTTKGRLRLPSASGLRAADACNGRVLVQVKRGKRTLSSRRVRVGRTCRFTSKVTFRDRKRLGTSRTLRFSVRFQGNKLLTPRSTSVKTVRIG
jgi:YD repeat-containing protein